jgi:hypothetical protein
MRQGDPLSEIDEDAPITLESGDQVVAISAYTVAVGVFRSAPFKP